LAERLAKDKDTIIESLEIMKSWMRDLVIATYAPGKILNRDIADEIQETAQNTSPTSLLSKIDLIQNTQNRIQANTNIRLSLEVMLMKMAAP
jgi:DNA polymerase-3 subunit delta'